MVYFLHHLNWGDKQKLRTQFDSGLILLHAESVFSI